MHTPADQYAALLPGAGTVQEDRLFEFETLPDEITLQAHWFSGDFGSRFTALDGRQIEVVQFGTWNRGEGPDFQDCAVRIGDEVVSGAIELDCDVRDWFRHRHEENPAFNSVVLHLFFQQGDRAVFTRTANHSNVPQVLLSAAALNTPHPLEQPLAKPGRCSAPLARTTSTELSEVLLAAAQYRLRRKAARMSRLAAMRGAGEALFQALAEALGYKQNKLPFTLLAQRLTLKELRRDPAQVEALLFGVGGFLPEQDLAKFGAETRGYLRFLWNQWWPARAQFDRIRIPQRLWKLSGSRPSNHPQRRLAALGEIVRSWKSIQGLMAFRDEREVFDTFNRLTHEYWNHHYTLTSKRSEKSLSLVGDSRVVEILCNVFYPPLIEANPERWNDYIQLAAPLGNRSAETAATRLLGNHPDRMRVLRSAARVQGLLQIFEDFCKRDATNCAECPFPEQLKQFRAAE